MKNNTCEETAIKIIWRDSVYIEADGYNSNDTNLPLNGKYEDEDGDIHYFKKGKYHNENGPAYITKDGLMAYRINGKHHRIDGPAVIYLNGNCNWYINGYHIDNEIMDNWLKENDIPLDWNIWTDSDKIMFALHWSDYTE